MAKIVLTDVHPSYDGEYDLAAATLTHRDFHTIKRLAGIRRNEIGDALTADDGDLILAFAVIVLERAGLTVDEDLLWNSPVGRLQLDLTEESEEAEKLPPQQTPPEPWSGADANKIDSKPTSGDDTKGSSENQANGLNPTGSPPSVTLSSVPAFAPVISQGSPHSN